MWLLAWLAQLDDVHMLCGRVGEGEAGRQARYEHEAGRQAGRQREAGRQWEMGLQCCSRCRPE